MTVFLLFLAAIAALLLAAFCAGAETGFLSVSRERILHLSRAGGHKGRSSSRRFRTCPARSRRCS